MPKGRAATVQPENEWFTTEEVEAFFRQYPRGFSCVIGRRFPGTMRLAKAAGMDDDEVESECLLAIATARRKFDRRRSERFSTYAVYWMRSKVSAEAKTRLRQCRTTVDGRRAISGDQDIGGGDTLFDLVAIEKQSRGEHDADLIDIIRTQLLALPSPLREIVELRNGLKSRTPMTLEEVAILRGVTKERIRQIENAAYERIRLPLQLALSKGGYL